MRKFLIGCLILLPVTHLSAGELLSLYEQALLSDPRLKISQQDLVISEARLDQKTSGLLPQVTLTATWTENQRELLATDDTTRYQGEKYNLMLRQDVINLAKWYDRKRYVYLKEEKKVRLKEAEIQVTSDLVQRYVIALSAQDELELIQAEKKANQKQLELMKSRYKKQLAKLTDLLTIEARLDGIKADEIAARAQVEISFEALSEVVGGAVTGPLPQLKEKIAFDHHIGSLTYWENLAQEQNPSLQSFRYNIQAAQQGIKQVKAEDLPTLNMSLSTQKSDIGFENSQTSRTQTYVASLNLSVPLYQGGAGSARKTEQRAMYEIAQEEYDEAHRNIMRTIREAYLKTEASRARMQAAKKAVDSAIKSSAAQEKGLKYGTVTVVDVLDALREQYRFRKDFRQSQYEFIQNWVQLLSYAGLLDGAKIEEIDSWQLAVSE